MALVEYSGSDDSDTDERVPAQEVSSVKISTKPTFQKVVDRSDPHKIKISLPEPSRAAPDEDIERSEHPRKRVKIGSGGLSGFNALLPAPKRATASAGGASINGTRKGGLGSGVSLRTGAAPGFSRDPQPSTEAADDDQFPARGSEANGEKQPSSDEHHEPVDYPMSVPSAVPEKLSEGNQKIPKKPMFKPLSVSQKPQKKRKLPPDKSLDKVAKTSEPTQSSNKTPKVPLFSSGDTSEPSAKTPSSTGAYQPIFYSANEQYSAPALDIEPDPDPENPIYATDSNPYPLQKPPFPPDPSPLSTLATDLNLSASAKRQLFGRHNPKVTAPINIVNFNTDAEYQSNELLRQAGETVAHNPVRAIAPGKHSLKQLVNAASNQKDALEESFASGRRNKKEAGSKYGW